MGTRAFHFVVDALDAAGDRLFSLPLTFLLLGWLLGVAVLVWLAHKLVPRVRPHLQGAALGWIAVIATVVAAVILIDHRQRKLQQALGALQRELAEDAKRRSFVSTLASTAEPSELQGRVGQLWSTANVSRAKQIEGIDYVTISSTEPRTLVVHVALIDLKTPALRIELPQEISTKRRLTEFCDERRCIVGINGEAGENPTLEAPLGKWEGKLIADGKPVLLKDSAERPFLAFDRENRARYHRASEVQPEPTPEQHNVIFGRWDLIVGGTVSTAFERATMFAPRPRCAMGIDAAGETLYLLTADGYQRGYSEGITMFEAGQLLRQLGAIDAMACDEGGSATMYLGARRGLVSRPPHVNVKGEPPDRPTYTNFGVSR